MTLLELFKLMKKHLRLVIILPVFCTLVTAGVSWFFLPNTYTSSVSMYVLTRSGDSSGNITSNDLSASQMLTNDVAQLIKSDRVMRETAESLRMTSLKGYDIEVTNSSSTRVVKVSVTGGSAESTAIIADALAATTDDVAREVMDVQSVNVIDKAFVPDAPSGPPRLMYTAVAFLAGLFVAVAIVVLMDMLNTRVRSADEAEELLGVPVIGRIPVIRG